MELVLTDAPPATSERDLILRAQAGDTEAFGELVKRYMRRAYFAALGLVGSREDALDLSQESFARAFRARQRIDPDRPYYTWHYQILRRLCFNFIRDRKSRRDKLKAAQGWLSDNASWRAACNDPQAQAQRKRTRQQVQAAIGRLGRNDREVLVLKEFEGLKYREIAELLGIPIGTVMSRLYAARQHLAAAIEDA